MAMTATFRGELVRKTLLGLMLLLVAAPAAADTITLGEGQLYSRLNQALHAEVPIRGSVATKGTLRVGQASDEAYRRVGVDRGRVPGDLEVELVGEGENRRAVLTTRRPVREPSVNVLLEVRWGDSRAMREVNLLLQGP